MTSMPVSQRRQDEEQLEMELVHRRRAHAEVHLVLVQGTHF